MGMAFFIPKFTIYIQSRTKRLIEIKNPDHRNKDSRKYKKLQIWKLIDIKNIYHTMDETLEIGIKAVKNENRNISETKTHKIWNIKKLVQGTRNRCEAKKWTKLIVLNYTERGKQQKIYYYISFKFLFYTLYIFYILHTHTHTHTDTHKYTHTNTQTHKHTNTHTHKHTNAQTHKH